MKNELNFPPNSEGLVLGCIGCMFLRALKNANVEFMFGFEEHFFDRNMKRPIEKNARGRSVTFIQLST